MVSHARAASFVGSMSVGTGLAVEEPVHRGEAQEGAGRVMIDFALPQAIDS